MTLWADAMNAAGLLVFGSVVPLALLKVIGRGEAAAPAKAPQTLQKRGYGDLSLIC